MLPPYRPDRLRFPALFCAYLMGNAGCVMCSVIERGGKLTSFLQVKQSLRTIGTTLLRSYTFSWVAYKPLLSFTLIGFRLLYITGW